MSSTQDPIQREEDFFKNSTMTFGEHLEELRACLFKAIIGLGLGFAIGMCLGNRVVDFIQTPLQNALESYYEKQAVKTVDTELEKLIESGYSEKVAKVVSERHVLPEKVLLSPGEMRKQLGIELDASSEGAGEPMVSIYLWHPIANDARVRAMSTSVHETFGIWIKASLLVGAMMSSPWIFFQIWSFVAAGLYPQEKKYVHVFGPFSVLLFLAGAATAFFFVFEPVLNFLFLFNEKMNIDPEPKISEWLSFVMILPLGFGVSFQLPLVMLFLERIGVFTINVYLEKWRIAILVIFIISMFLTPADPTSMLLMALPLTVLYFLGILLCRFMPRRESPFEERFG